MPELLKNRYNYESIRKVAEDIHLVYNTFQVERFLDSTLDETWDKLELKARIYQISINLGKYLPAQYNEALNIIDAVVGNYGNWLDNFCAFFPTFIEIYGQDEENWDISMRALENYTQYASAEFAVRPFIIKHEKRMITQMVAWSKHKNEHIRRLSCEGCRPQLPWGQSLVSFKNNPAPIIPILNQLKTDPSIHVRKSVANNLNDISKTHPELVMELAKSWYGKNEYTDWIIKHGCRTLLKKGNRDALSLFGYNDIDSLCVDDFALDASAILIGNNITFTFSVSTMEKTKVRLEYGIDYVKSNGKRNRKIFQISQSLLKENERKFYTKKHSFADVSVRKHFPGTHSITLIINGVERGKQDFDLTK